MSEPFERNKGLDHLSIAVRASYERLRQQINTVRANQGSAGCYMELLNTLSAFANRFLICLSLPDYEQKVIEAFDVMYSVLLDLPLNQDESTLEAVWETLAQNELIRNMLTN